MRRRTRPTNGTYDPAVTWIEPDRVPPALRTADFVLEPLGPEHNERDHLAWMSSIGHIRSTPGFGSGDWGDDAWPVAMSLAENLVDLEMHRREFDTGEAFAWSVLDHAGNVIGCVYIDPDPTGECDAAVRCWVTANAAALDVVLADAIRAWTADAWPIRSVRFPGRT
ncbi:MAG: hypothetical protein JWL72_3206 [Ilumatobacteraceae bacterium]|nr:hypothetical protein [Ilumatobacteraceae bacterium]